MKIVIIILAVLPAALSCNYCEVCLDGRCFCLEVILDYPQTFQTLVNILGVDYTDHTFFLEFKSIYSHSNVKAFGKHFDIDKDLMTGLKGPLVGAINSRFHSKEVHISSWKGNYRFNTRYGGFSIDETDHLIDINTFTNIQYQAFYDIWYVTYWNNSGIYTFQDSPPRLSTFLGGYHIEEFAADKNKNLYYRMNDKLYHFNSIFSSPTMIGSFKTPYFKLFATSSGVVYVKANSCFYKIVNQEVIEIGHLYFARDIKPVFDWDDNIVFIDSGKLYRLKWVPYRACSFGHICD